MPETRVLLKLIGEENQLALAEAREKLDHLQAEEDKEYKTTRERARVKNEPVIILQSFI